MKVLLIDDHEIFRLGLRSLLEAAGFTIAAEASDGETGLSLLRDNPADVVVLDYSLPGISGLDLLPKIKRQGKNTNVVLLTASSSDSILGEALAAGFDGVVQKQDTGEQLVQALTAVSAGENYISQSIQPMLERLDGLAKLTRRERQVLRMIAGGYRNREISEALSVSLKTVDTHRTNLMRKLDLHSLADVLDFANNSGILDSSI